MSQAELSSKFDDPRITPAQRRGAGVVAAGWSLRTSASWDAAAGDLRTILDALFAEPKRRRPL